VSYAHENVGAKANEWEVSTEERVQFQLNECRIKENAPHEAGDYLRLVARGEEESDHRHKDFQLCPPDLTPARSQKVHPTRGKLCAQNFLGCLYETDLVELF